MRARATGLPTVNAFRNIGAGRISRHSPWSLGTRVMSGTVGQAVGRQNSPAARMGASLARPSSGVRSTSERSGPAIHTPCQSAGVRSAVSNHPRLDDPPRLAPVVATRTDQ